MLCGSRHQRENSSMFARLLGISNLGFGDLWKCSVLGLGKFWRRWARPNNGSRHFSLNFDFVRVSSFISQSHNFSQTFRKISSFRLFILNPISQSRNSLIIPILSRFALFFWFFFFKCYMQYTFDHLRGRQILLFYLMSLSTSYSDFFSSFSVICRKWRVPRPSAWTPIADTKRVNNERELCTHTASYPESTMYRFWREGCRVVTSGTKAYYCLCCPNGCILKINY